MQADDTVVATEARKHVINIVVEVDGKNRHVQFDSSPVTGRAIRDLVSIYGDGVRTAREGARTFVRLPEVEMPPGCRPQTTPMLLAFDPDQPKPLAFIQPGQLLANGREPRSTSTQMVGGESWMHFSLNIPWAEGQNIMRFVAASRQRFAQNE